ncbi:MAG: flagellar basal body L-ring protein FlgH [Legionellales bacterium]|nr:flagellar basal body L-ring protein FlgH [Legionellales bacterium]
MFKHKIKFVILTSVIILSGCRGPEPNDVRFSPVYPHVAQASANRTGSIYQDATAVTLFADDRARRVGDILTVRLVENTTGKKEATTSTENKTSIDVSNPTLLGMSPKFNNGRGNLGFNMQKDNSFEGTGESEQKNNLQGTITVSVAQVLGNGNLVIRGEKWVQINQGKEFIRLTGIVRPADIDENNSVDSTRVADARIAYSGTGQVAETNVAGWFGRFFMGALGGIFPW